MGNLKQYFFTRRKYFKKSMALIICLCFLVVTLLSTYFITAHMIHDCGIDSGQCEVCMQLGSAGSLIKVLKTGISIAFLASLICIALSIVILMTYSEKRTITPIMLKVRLNN